MTTFDLDEVRAFAASIDDQMNRCDNNEGMECATLDAALTRYAELCCKFRDEVRRWGRAVFAGSVQFDPKVEGAWLDEGLRLYKRAMATWANAQTSEGPCYILEGRVVLQAALWDMYRLLTGWVTPRLAVGPSARRACMPNSAATDEAKQRVSSLPPLPVRWQPDDLSQRTRYRRPRKS
jgi:hypothetical protein